MEGSGTRRQNFGQMIRAASNLIEILFKFINTSPSTSFACTLLPTHSFNNINNNRIWSLSLDAIRPRTSSMDEKYEHTKWENSWKFYANSLKRFVLISVHILCVLFFFTDFEARKTTTTFHCVRAIDWKQQQSNLYVCVRSVVVCSWLRKVRAWKKIETNIQITWCR